MRHTEINADSKRNLNIAEVVDLVGVSRATIYRMIDSGEFPRPVRITTRRVVWVRAEIDAWMDEKMEARRA